MTSIGLMPHQVEALEQLKDFNRCAVYYDMGLGKTFIGSEKLKQLNANQNLVVCQKSKIDDWYQHFSTYYDYPVIMYTKSVQIPPRCVLIINYDMIWRRAELAQMQNFTLLLDESSHIKNESSKRSKFILKLKPSNVILLSGTPTGGKYEELWSQCQLLGWKISKTAFWNEFIVYDTQVISGYNIKMVRGYKNVNLLKEQLRKYGAIFKKSEETLSLPLQIYTVLEVDTPAAYKLFKKHRMVEVAGKTLVGDMVLNRILYLRQLSGMYNPNKLERLQEIMESTHERLIVFYEFKAEYEQIFTLCNRLGKPVATVNGDLKDLTAYKHEGSVTLIQYQAGAMGLNLQFANKIIYFTLPRSSGLFEQSKKRIHRIGQQQTCFYYYLLTKDSIDWHIFEALRQRKDYTDELFREREERDDYFTDNRKVNTVRHQETSSSGKEVSSAKRATRSTERKTAGSHGKT